MASKGAETREKILDTAEALVLECGFSGVSVDKVIKSLGMTKGAFFHHFKNKNEMAAHLIERYARMDNEFFNACMKRADALSSDPLQQVLIMIGLYVEEFSGLEEPYPGCLLASYVYEISQFDDSILEIVSNEFLFWRRNMKQRFEIIASKYPPTDPVDVNTLADEFIVTIEGAFILAKSLNDPDIVINQLNNYKHYIELLFQKDK